VGTVENAAGDARPLEGEELEQVLMILKSQPDVPIVGMSRERVVATLHSQHRQISELRASIRILLDRIRELEKAGDPK
jgi:hypothetical protein